MAGKCFCGKWLAAKTAWTDANAGRRFISCERCRFFRWLDEPLCERSRAIIPGLLRRINKLEAQQRPEACKRIGFVDDTIGGHMVCSEEGGRLELSDRSGMEVQKEKCSCNISLTFLIVTWIAIILYCFCKMQEGEDYDV